ncbi:predicted protein [Streptomyces viridochromogenes DSM 40736]|uniref:Predicted protein n=1 Tax=Streptomyces viridochromogenes (strain DSM 40736 / JCM 4977 / BCRC 1201 / Tue 494) TaxID=591159 RepID=D9X1B4_STRVT|nr:hypothetical protein [Streptomyces viridochromogenes]EFL33552.1 predicted protein [Streptomyces viridochromogenes DSM 40736]
MTTRLDDDGPEFGSDDPLAVILRPSSPDYLSAPSGHYEAIRRRATRRRLLRTAAGAGLLCATAALLALPLRLTSPEPPGSPTIPMAPPSRTTAPPPSSPSPSGPTSDAPTGPASGVPTDRASDAPTHRASDVPTGRASEALPTSPRRPSAAPTLVRPVPSATRPYPDQGATPSSR